MTTPPTSGGILPAADDLYSRPAPGTDAAAMARIVRTRLDQWEQMIHYITHARVYTRPDVLTRGVAEGWADPRPDPALIDWAPRQAAAAIPFEVVDGRPVNPCARTGIRYGRGELGHWGEALAASAVVMATDPYGDRWIVMVHRVDGHGWALPDGILEPDEDSVDAAVRELKDKTGLDLPGAVWHPGAPRYVPDPRASDESWIVTVPVRTELGRVAQLPALSGGDDAARAAWIRADSYPLLTGHLATVYAGTVFAAHRQLLTDLLPTPEPAPAGGRSTADPASPDATRQLRHVLAAITACDPVRRGQIRPDTPAITAAYRYRNMLVWQGLAAAQRAGIPAGVDLDPGDARHPMVVYLELPAGQVSWHLPAHTSGWDGHDTAEKYRRIEIYLADGQPPDPLLFGADRDELAERIAALAMTWLGPLPAEFAQANTAERLYGYVGALLAELEGVGNLPRYRLSPKDQPDVDLLAQHLADRWPGADAGTKPARALLGALRELVRRARDDGDDPHEALGRLAAGICRLIEDRYELAPYLYDPGIGYDVPGPNVAVGLAAAFEAESGITAQLPVNEHDEQSRSAS